MLTRLYKAIKEAVKGKPLKLRSPRWDDVRKIHLKSFPTCAACGSETNHALVVILLERFLFLVLNTLPSLL